MKTKPVYHRFDYVEIVEPLIFVRCGYPLCFNDVRAELTSQYLGQLDTGIRALQKTLTESGWPTHLVHSLATAESDILTQMTKADLQHKHYGGKERTIHTRLDEKWRGKRVRVMDKRVVKTGAYREGYSSGEYGEDYTSATLRKAKTHVILAVEWHGDANTFDFDSFEIEACHVKPWVDRPLEIPQ